MISIDNQTVNEIYEYLDSDDPLQLLEQITFEDDISTIYNDMITKIYAEFV